MKRFLTLAVAVMAMVSFFSVKSFALPNNTYTCTNNFTADCEIPILVTSLGGTIHLGAIAPGTTRDLLTSSNFMDFQVSGGNGWKVNILTAVTTQGSLGAVTPLTPANVWLSGIKWQKSDDGITFNDLLLGGSAVTGDINANFALTEALHNMDGGLGSVESTGLGKKYFRVAVDQIHAGTEAATGLYTFPVSLTATYMDMLFSAGVPNTGDAMGFTDEL